MAVAAFDPLTKLRVTVGLHNGSQETWEQYNCVITEYAEAGTRILADLRREVEDDSSVALQAAQAVGRMGDDGWPTLKALLTHSSLSVRHSAIAGGVYELVSSYKGNEETTTECAQALADILQNDDPFLRSEVLRVMQEAVTIVSMGPLIPTLVNLADRSGKLGEEARKTVIAWGNDNNLADLADLGDDPASAAHLQKACERAKAWVPGN